MIPIAVGPVARARNGVIGRAGGLPWRLKSDLRIFKEVTLGKPVIMGRKTWESLPRRPLPGRLNLVLSRDESFSPLGAVSCSTAEEAFDIAREQAEEDGAEEVCVIGGAALFSLAVSRARRIYLTEVEVDARGDVSWALPDLTGWREVRRDAYPAGEGDEHPFVFRVLER